MSKLKIMLGCALCASLMLSSFAACGKVDDGKDDDGGNGGNEPPKTQYTVTFDTNGGSEVPSQTVEEGGKAVKPENDPTKTDYVFSGWCKDAALDTAYDFETETITSATTIYASWAAASDTSVAKFYWNYDGAAEDVFVEKTFGNGSRIPDPGAPVRTGYVFGGWFTEDGTQYTKSKKFTGNQNFYASWQTIYTFEAEKTQLTGLEDDYDLGLATESGDKRGHNFSGEAHGANLIKSDGTASGGKYVSGLFYRDAYLQFEINSDKEVKGATLRLVASVEYADIKLTSGTYKITVNGKQISFNDFTLGNGSTTSSTNPGIRGGFKEIFISNIDLVAGKNVIRLTVNNSQTPAGEAGTVDAASPAVDCIKIYADAALTMTEYENK